jgi:transcriptional regulator with XRE-family HTH domain
MSQRDALKRAKKLAENDYRLINELIQQRIDKGLSQQDVADRLGITQQAVSRFEKMDNDPRLSSIREYAHAIEALVWHAVEADTGQLAQEGKWTTLAVCFTSVREAPGSYPVAATRQADFAFAA